MEEKSLSILFCGWINIPHSYAIVNCFQLVHLYKNYGPNGKIKKNKILIISIHISSVRIVRLAT